MDIFMDLVSFFGIDLISEAETFPELLQTFFLDLFGMYLIVFTMRAMFAATYRIREDLVGRR